MERKYTILVIDDKIENLKYITKVLENENFDIRASTDPIFAIKAANIEKPDLILLDIKMPKIDGFETCKIIKNDNHLKDIPIIFISALDDTKSKIEAFEKGGVDYITKPFEEKEIIARIKNQLEIHNSKKMIEKLLIQQDMFVKKIMHEMNTPVSIISLNCESIEKKVGPQDEIEVIKASTKTLASIYGDISYIVKKEFREYQKTDINISKFLTSRIMFFDEMANLKNISINLELYEDFFISINEYELERIIDNTISNAIKYSKKDSQIDIIIKKPFLKIKDYGVGIEEGINPFIPYYQQFSKNIGLGLGLTIVKDICDKYTIDIEVKSEKNSGTEFNYDFNKVVI
jgi:DNA-binding response OmpR family regulator